MPFSNRTKAGRRRRRFVGASPVRSTSSVSIMVSSRGVRPVGSPGSAEHDSSRIGDLPGRGGPRPARPGGESVRCRADACPARRPRRPAPVGRGGAHGGGTPSWLYCWPRDAAGHRAGMTQAVALLDHLDEVLGGLIEVWRDGPDLTVITSDHGNLEDLSDRGHTRNPAPGILIGPAALRPAIAPRRRPLPDFHDVILDVIFGGMKPSGQWSVVGGQ